MKLKDQLTILYLPFEIADGIKQQTLFEKSSTWQKCSKVSIDKDYLYPYVWQFINGATDPADNLQIYELKDDGCESFNNNTFTIEFKKQNKQYNYQFRFCLGRKLDAPHVIIYPHCPVGILMMGIELLDKIELQDKDKDKERGGVESQDKGKYKGLTLDDLKMFNYALHKIGHRPSVLRSNKKDFAKKLFGSEDGAGFTLLDLCKKSMLDDVVDSKIEPLEKISLHVFSYIQVSDVENIDEFRSAISQIASIQTDTFQTSGCASKQVELFRNIYICSRNEGGVMATVLTPEYDDQFIKEYKGKFTAQYLWIYTFTIMQYYALISLINRLYLPLTNKAVNKNINQLWQIKKHIFTCISRVTHINQFYKTIVNNLELHSLLETLNENYNYMHDCNQTRSSIRTNWILAFLTISQAVFAILSFFTVNVVWKPFFMIAFGVLWCIICLVLLSWYILPVSYVSTQVRNNITNRKSIK